MTAERDAAQAHRRTDCARDGHQPVDHHVRRMCGTPVGALLCACGEWLWSPKRTEDA